MKGYANLIQPSTALCGRRSCVGPIKASHTRLFLYLQPQPESDSKGDLDRTQRKVSRTHLLGPGSCSSSGGGSDSGRLLHKSMKEWRTEQSTRGTEAMCQQSGGRTTMSTTLYSNQRYYACKEASISPHGGVRRPSLEDTCTMHHAPSGGAKPTQTDRKQPEKQ